ncbi:uncharacterized protein A1O5_12197 [Cladophialophora psammophila CBS 110553]|uniref:Uncharacterized protein n=1 Tax=Cladophialophora psammophila CBS 110553 TaxID=1182543 RepID=W9W445_9EURO|nr:uncharacterized protein A1O5_12197 [Cladophialophora psammophila CBS 110553]EXJ59316.1 hypothetical protein A1O5_12197 [Cladophialophora psammophila CBS 110553]
MALLAYHLAQSNDTKKQEQAERLAQRVIEDVLNCRRKYDSLGKMSNQMLDALKVELNDLSAKR